MCSSSSVHRSVLCTECESSIGNKLALIVFIVEDNTIFHQCYAKITTELLGKSRRKVRVLRDLVHFRKEFLEFCTAHKVHTRFQGANAIRPLKMGTSHQQHKFMNLPLGGTTSAT